jgi:hypothetical protein
VYKKQVILNVPRLAPDSAHYAEPQRLSVLKFRRLTRQFELNPLAQYWHDLFHPAALDSSHAGKTFKATIKTNCRYIRCS